MMRKHMPTQYRQGDRPVRRLLWLMLALGLSPVASAGEVLQAPIVLANPAGVQQLTLNLTIQAAIQQQPKQVWVLDKQGQVMPMRINTRLDTEKTQNIVLPRYQWPSQLDELGSTDEISQPELDQLSLQLRQGRSVATVTWPAATRKLSLQQRGTARQWLLAAPELNVESFAGRRLVFDWPAQPLSTTVSVEGSNDLVSWQYAGQSQLLETRNDDGKLLKQQHVPVDGNFKFWRVTLGQPLALSNVSLSLKQAVATVSQQQTLQFKPTAQAGEWVADLPQPIQVEALQFKVPDGQLWVVNVEARYRVAGQPLQWRSIAAANLFHVPGSGGCENNLPCTARFYSPMVSQQWRLKVQGAPAQQDLSVQAQAPQQDLYFLAQGQAPYRIQLGGEVSSQPAYLPEQKSPVYPATLGALSAQPAAVPVRQYALWAGLIVLVLLLAFAAWRLLQNMQPKTGASG